MKRRSILRSESTRKAAIASPAMMTPAAFRALSLSMPERAKHIQSGSSEYFSFVCHPSLTHKMRLKLVGLLLVLPIAVASVMRKEILL